ncbi:MAG: hypothetical protein ACKVWR_07190 [Acidimicrobiales bacterium]
MAAAALALPVASLVAAPLLFPFTTWSRRLSRHWRSYTTLSSGVASVACVGLLADATPLPAALRTAIAGLGALAGLRLALRQRLLARVSRQQAPATASIAIAAITASSVLGVAA